MYGTPKPRQEVNGGLGVLALQALANYSMSGLAQKGEHMHEEIALRIARKLSKGEKLEEG